MPAAVSPGSSSCSTRSTTSRRRSEGRWTAAILRPRAAVAQLARASACHAEGRGFESHQPLRKGLHLQAFFVHRIVRLRHRTMTGQSCPPRLADAVGRCSLAGDSARPAPWNFCVPAEDRESTAPGRCSCPWAPLRLVRDQVLPFVEERHSQPALLLVVRRASERRLGGNARFSSGATFLPRSLRVQLAWKGRLCSQLCRAPGRRPSRLP